MTIRMKSDGALVRSLNRVLRRVADAVAAPDRPIRRRLSPAYSRLLGLLSGGRGYPAEINGSLFRIDPRFRWAVWHRHERTVADYLSARVTAGQCCFDVGANIGLYVLQFARWAAPSGRVVAFEPNPATLEVLRAHVRMNGLEDRVTIVPMAAGAAAGDAQLYDTSPGSGLSRIGGAHPGIEMAVTPVEIPLTTIDDYCRASRAVPDWMLIDVEGYEYEVLLGAADTLRRHRPRVLVELHQPVSSEASRAAGLRLLDELGLVSVRVPGTEEGRRETFVTLEPRT
jgi:FkbM family methyltransferase